MDESIIVSSIIDKLPSSWKDFKKNLKHKKEDISLEQLGNHLRLEEEYRKQDAEKETNVQEKAHPNIRFKKEGKLLVVTAKGNQVKILAASDYDISKHQTEMHSVQAPVNDVQNLGENEKNAVSEPEETQNKSNFHNLFEIPKSQCHFLQLPADHPKVDKNQVKINLRSYKLKLNTSCSAYGISSTATATSKKCRNGMMSIPYLTYKALCVLVKAILDGKSMAY
ncbi:cold shock domain-containing protein 3-like [Senna tora]|uniref:Cold shock domain-containing protein 3-like n=1 Tax=Senna tora TaxID=362788 RepID=A0A834X742_9FABA|nr:cold shock domain-containing protein 3-like [Senna tora]